METRDQEWEAIVALEQEKLAAAEQRGRALLAVAKAAHDLDRYPCLICGRILHPAVCDCPVAKLDTEYPGWRTEWRHGRPHDSRMAEDHDEA